MPLTLKDAIRLASKDPEFAKHLAQNPESLKQQFNLTDDQVQKIKAAASGSVAKLSATPAGYY